jgi:cytochrome b
LRAVASPSGRATRERTVQVWDLPTRLFHWLLVLLVTIGFVTGFVAPE